MGTASTDEAETVADGPTRREALSPKPSDPADPDRSLPPSGRFGRLRLTSGSRLAGGRFIIHSTIGEGGMGTVYEAFDAERSEMVALKSIVRRTAQDYYLLKSEFRSVADLVHDNLVRLYELFVDDEHCFFTMELVPGIRFDYHVRPRGELDEAALRDALRQLLSAVAAIHGVGKLHRDLKPNNVLVDPDGRVVVLDFGLVMEPGRGALAGPIDGGAIVGTPAYMAPEQVSAEHAAPAMDLYAIGVMLFEALCDQLPFAGTDLEIMRAKPRVAAPRVRTANPRAPGDLAGVCDALLAIDPSERPTLEAIREHLALTQPEPRTPHGTRTRHTPAPSALIGRDRELCELRSAYRASCDGERPVVALIAGESGIGKSALVEHLLAQLRAQGEPLLLRGRCYEREAVPFKAFDAVVDALSRYLDNSDGTELRQMRRPDLAALHRLFPVLGCIPLVAECAAARDTDARELRRQGFGALSELLAQIGRWRPLVIFIDDLQWSDRDSTALLLHVLLQPHAPRMLLIGTHRRGDHTPGTLVPIYEALESEPRVDLRRLELGPLEPEAAQELARALSSRDATALASEAGGNPFLLGALSRWPARDAPRGTGRVSLTDALRQRVSELEPSEQRLLQVLAVAARPLPLAIAAQAADVEGVEHAAIDLLRKECLGRSGGPPGSVECYHDRIREAVVEALSETERRGHHLALATTLASRSTADPEHLYAHYEQAGERARAARYAREAASRAVGSLAFERAISLCDRALALGEFATEERQQLRETRAEALAYAGRGPAAAEAYRDAARDAPPERAIVLQRRAAEQLLMSGALDAGRALLTDTLATLGVELPRTRARLAASLLYQRGRARLRGLPAVGRAQVSARDRQRLDALLASGSALSRTDPLAAAEAAARHRVLAFRVGDSTDIARALSWELLFASMLEKPGARIAKVIERARQAAEASGDWEARASFHRHHGFYLRSKHAPDMHAALAELEHSLTIHREHPLPTSYYDRPWGEWNRDVVRCFLGRFSEVAQELPAQLDEAVQRSDMCIFPMWASTVLPRLAVGRQEAAEAAFAHARRMWPSPGPTLQNLSLLEAETLLANAAGRPERAKPNIERAFRTVTDSPLHRGSSIVGLVAGLRARNAARLAELSRAPEKRRELIDTIVRCAALMGRSKALWYDHTGDPVRAAAAYLRGDRELAAQHLRRGAQRLSGVPVWAHACQRQLGVLLGGDEGRALVAQSDAFFRAGGAIDGERIAAVLNPGFED